MPGETERVAQPVDHARRIAVAHTWNYSAGHRRFLKFRAIIVPSKPKLLTRR
jgi:hypothetical protein